MATDLATLVRRTRRFVRDYPDADTITASVASNATALTVADTTKYAVGQRIEVDYETMIVRALASGTSLTVSRAMFDSTAASHASSASLLKAPAYLFSDYVDGLNMGLQATFPLIYKPVLDTSLTGLADTYEYTVPNMPSTSTPIPYLSRVEVKESGDLSYRKSERWTIRRGATPKIKFRSVPALGATFRVHGYGPFPSLSATSDTLDTLFPTRAEYLLTMYAAQWVLMSGEAGRVRHDSGSVDAREQASRPGASSAAANALLQRFQLELAKTGMPAMPKHVVSTAI